MKLYVPYFMLDNLLEAIAH